MFFSSGSFHSFFGEINGPAAQESMSSIKEELLQAPIAPECRLRFFPAPVQNNQGLALILGFVWAYGTSKSIGESCFPY